MAASSENHVELGFLEKVPSWTLRSRYFPSKVGGFPAWLDLKNVPQVEDLQCRNCGEQCVFLLQVYACIDEHQHTFHRTIFVFMCKDSKCCAKNVNTNFLVFRCQLSRQNEFYSDEPANEDERCLRPCVQDYLPVCVVCGVRGPKQCGKCHDRNYCTKAHQLLDWKAGHKASCSKEVDKEQYTSEFLLPEFEIVTEPEEEEGKEVPEKSEAERLEEFQQFVEEKGGALLGEDGGTDGFFDESLNEDKQYKKFMKRIKQEPEQVIRYQRGGDPLWVSTNNIPQPADIPPCSCGSVRQFEVQILPQLLNHLGLDTVGDSIDWGTLAIYTCAASCDEGPAYHSEVLWKQDF